jgi:hypothetical protein
MIQSEAERSQRCLVDAMALQEGIDELGDGADGGDGLLLVPEADRVPPTDRFLGLAIGVVECRRLGRKAAAGSLLAVFVPAGEPVGATLLDEASLPSRHLFLLVSGWLTPVILRLRPGDRKGWLTLFLRRPALLATT